MVQHEWHLDIKNVLELAEFMVDSDQVTTAKELLEYFKHPERFTEVWDIYQSEIHGKASGSYRSNSDTKNTKASIPVMLALNKKP